MKYLAMWAISMLLMTGCVPQQSHTSKSKVNNIGSASCSSGITCQNIGLKYVGRGDKKSYTIASKYFLKSCNYGESEGCNNLAFLYANARGVKQSYTLAYKYWGMSCRMGNGLACTNLELAKDKVAHMKK